MAESYVQSGELGAEKNTQPLPSGQKHNCAIWSRGITIRFPLLRSQSFDGQDLRSVHLFLLGLLWLDDVEMLMQY